MLIRRKSILSGITREIDLPVTEEQMQRLNNGELIQVVLPHLSPTQREFILTGSTAEEWDETFLELDDE